jgi:leucyl/phenylalanyl-tRNA--protein transferase
MPVFRLNQAIAFPPPHLALPEGLLAVGGDLSLPRLVAAYRLGIFPWYTPDEPILWWSPDPRLVIYPRELHVPRRLARTLRQGRFRITYDQAFAQVVTACAGTRRGEHHGTWIVPEMAEAYNRLHRAGIAHSVEAWHSGTLAGGLYGVSLGAVFFGESMFSHVRDSSKAALVDLLGRLRAAGFQLVDCQVTTEHLQRFGAREIPRRDFLRQLAAAVARPTLRGRWRAVGEGIDATPGAEMGADGPGAGVRPAGTPGAGDAPGGPGPPGP